MSEGGSLLQMRGIRKSFVGVEVLHGVDIDLDAGEIHAIVGENGAGKSTLMKILAGAHVPDEGTIEIDGQAAQLRTTRTRRRRRASASSTRSSTCCPTARWPRTCSSAASRSSAGSSTGARWNAPRPRCWTRSGSRASTPQTLVRRLSVAQQQVVEIVKARSLDARILVLDEPTAALADHEVELLFALVRRLQERGIGMLYISHRLREVFTLADRITVLKDGALVKTLPTCETDSRGLVNLMVGRELDGYFPPRGEAADLGEVRPGRQERVDAAAARRQPAGPRRRDRRSRRAPGIRPDRARACDLRCRPAGRRQHRDRRQGGPDQTRRGRRSAPGSASSPRTASSRASRSRSRSPTTCCSRCGPSSPAPAGAAAPRA